MSSTDAPERISTVEAAKALGIRTAEVYHLIFDGVLDGRPIGNDGVRVTVASVASLRAQREGEPEA